MFLLVSMLAWYTAAAAASAKNAGVQSGDLATVAYAGGSELDVEVIISRLDSGDLHLVSKGASSFTSKYAVQTGEDGQHNPIYTYYTYNPSGRQYQVYSIALFTSDAQTANLLATTTPYVHLQLNKKLNATPAIVDADNQRTGGYLASTGNASSTFDFDATTVDLQTVQLVASTLQTTGANDAHVGQVVAYAFIYVSSTDAHDENTVNGSFVITVDNESTVS